MYLKIYSAYSLIVFPLVVQSAFENNFIAKNNVTLFAIVAHLLVSIFLFVYAKKHEDVKTIKSEVIAQCDQPISKRKTLVKVSDWIFIVIVYFNQQLLVEQLPFWGYIIATTLNVSLIFMIMYPLVIESNYGFKQSPWLTRLTLPIILYVVYIFLSMGYSSLLEFLKVLPETSSENQQLLEALIISNPVRMIFSAVLVAPIMEEWIYRGLGFRTLIHRNKFLAYFTSFLVFGFIHVGAGLISGNGLSEFLFLPAYGLSGIIFGYSYEKTGSIYFAMAVHLLNNLVATLSILLT
ncbi:MAG: CPBP family intramembrane metalloprotease [Erysipelothrix sp.]|nr:CPBP family intramembrane metalloprotease [Erysipelothrix sp.]